EALRTVEDQLRFTLALPPAARRWKQLRGTVRELRGAVEKERPPLALLRDTPGDPGHPDTSDHDPHRTDLRDLLAANAARASQASRSIEEALRMISPELAGRAERLRYALYEEEAAVVRLLAPRQQLADARLYALVTTALAAGPIVDVTAAAIAGGAQIIQLREKELPAREFLALARDLRAVTAELGALLIINDRLDIAGLSEADGVHQGQDDLRPADVRRILGPDTIVGVSTHSANQAAAAERDGADYIGVGPIFPTATKEHRAAVGLEYIQQAATATSLPGFAIGSVKLDNVHDVIAAGAQRIAVCTGIIAAADVEAAARGFRSALDEAAENRANG
ncbi:MAG: thiamine phosphate synthase, partial [Planctomycetota bacterium]